MKLYIEEQKIINYLLKPIDKADKSKFLNLIGYNVENWEQLRDDLISQFSNYSIYLYEENEFGVLYKIEGKLIAPLKTVDLITIWIKLKKYNFLKLVTLYPK